MFLRQIAKDSMLYLVLAAPVLAAFAFRFGISNLENLLCSYFGKASVLAPYYLLFDLLLATLTPYMVCFASSMVMLTEQDENLADYMAVTPVGRRGYVVSRLGFPAVAAFLASVVLLRLFSLTGLSLPDLLAICLLTDLLGVTVSLLIVCFSHNRVEGMALAKLAGVLMLGLPVPFFLSSGVQYLFSPLPSFWIAKFSLEGGALPLFPALLLSLLWIWMLYGRYDRKVF
jgi:fluoroquinolone transport system permease protein